MRAAALVMVFLAGLALLSAVFLLWRQLRGRPGGRWWTAAVWCGLALLTAGLIACIVDGRDLDFTYGVLVAWATVASVFFLGRFVSGPSLGLLVLPAGAVALLIAPAWGTGRIARGGESGLAVAEGGWITWIHVIFMALHTVAALLAAALAIAWLVTRRQLKTAATTALQMPKLPALERLLDAGIVCAAALLIGGLATGGAAAARSGGVDLLHGTPLLGMLAMLLLTLLLALLATRSINRRSLAWGTLAVSAVTAATILTLLVAPPHGR